MKSQSIYSRQELLKQFKLYKKRMTKKDREEATLYLNYILSGRGDVADCHELQNIITQYQ